MLNQHAPMTQRLSPAAKALLDRHIEFCLLCNRRFHKGETAHLGYTANGSVVIVGDCCSAKLVETAIRKYYLLRPFETPPNNSSLWRYMDFEKYVALLTTQSLFFCRLDKLEDHYEGAMGSVTNETLWRSHYLRFFSEAVMNPPPGYERPQLSSTQLQSEAERLLADFRDGNETKPKSTFVNCWCERNSEAHVMWRSYSHNPQFAVAVETTAARLRSAISVQKTIGRIRYIDYEKEFPDIGFPHFYKRTHFEDEREVRAVILDMSGQDVVGKTVAVDLRNLVQRVTVSPEAPTWFISVVGDVTKKFDLEVEIVSSSLAKKAFR